MQKTRRNSTPGRWSFNHGVWHQGASQSDEKTLKNWQNILCMYYQVSVNKKINKIKREGGMAEFVRCPVLPAKKDKLKSEKAHLDHFFCQCVNVYKPEFKCQSALFSLRLKLQPAQ